MTIRNLCLCLLTAVNFNIYIVVSGLLRIQAQVQPNSSSSSPKFKPGARRDDGTRDVTICITCPRLPPSLLLSLPTDPPIHPTTPTHRPTLLSHNHRQTQPTTPTTHTTFTPNTSTHARARERERERMDRMDRNEHSGTREDVRASYFTFVSNHAHSFSLDSSPTCFLMIN